MNIADQVEGYIALRDKKAELKAKYQSRVDAIDKVMAQVEANLLTHFGETGADSVATPVGTAYKSTKTQVSAADWDSFIGFVRENEAWEMLEKRPAKNAVLEWADEHEALPPGLNMRTEVSINIRRK